MLVVGAQVMGAGGALFKALKHPPNQKVTIGNMGDCLPIRDRFETVTQTCVLEKRFGFFFILHHRPHRRRPAPAARAPPPVTTAMGYDIGIFVNDVPQCLVCSICQDVFKDPVTGCGPLHSFCGGCLAEWLSKEGIGCPLCKEIFDPHKELTRVRLAEEMISALLVRCPARSLVAGLAGAGPSGGGGGPDPYQFIDGINEGRNINAAAAAAAAAGSRNKRRRGERTEGVGDSSEVACTWTGKLAELDAHCALCDFAEVSHFTRNNDCSSYSHPPLGFLPAN